MSAEQFIKEYEELSISQQVALYFKVIEMRSGK